MNKQQEEEPEDAGLIQSKPPTEKELQEISHFIAQSKRRNAGQLPGLSLPAERHSPPEEESSPSPNPPLT